MAIFIGIVITHGIFGDRGKIFFFWICMPKSISDQIHTHIYIYEHNRKEGGRKEGRKEGGRKEGRKEDHIIIFIRLFT